MDVASRLPVTISRDRRRGLLGGVCAGLAAYFALPAIVARVVFWLGLVVSNWALVAYLVLWMLLPDAGDPAPISLRASVQSAGGEVHGWLAELLRTLMGQAEDAASTLRLRTLGRYAIALLLVDVARRLHWFGHLGPDHLKPLVLVIVGTVFIRHALIHSGGD